MYEQELWMNLTYFKMEQVSSAKILQLILKR